MHRLYKKAGTIHQQPLTRGRINGTEQPRKKSQWNTQPNLLAIKVTKHPKYDLLPQGRPGSSVTTKIQEEEPQEREIVPEYEPFSSIRHQTDTTTNSRYNDQTEHDHRQQIQRNRKNNRTGGKGMLSVPTPLPMRAPRGTVLITHLKQCNNSSLKHTIPKDTTHSH
ncbi:hypothetical protein JTB14_030556 [Gonioctena quinquepunctata]|nr:hypothetical protein JTB14_030556 [Gonioctena quinquepunctata]